MGLGAGWPLPLLALFALTATLQGDAFPHFTDKESTCLGHTVRGSHPGPALLSVELSLSFLAIWGKVGGWLEKLGR